MKKTLLVLFLFLTGCMEPPIPPSWDVTFNLSVATRKILMRDITSDTLEADSILLLQESYAIDTIRVGDEVRLDSCARDIFLTLKDMRVNKLYPDTLFFGLGRMFPWLVPYHGQTIDSIPDTSFSVSETLDFAEDFEMIEIDSGCLRIRIFNRLPFEIDSLHLTLITPSFIKINFPNIPPGESEESECALAGYTISNTFVFELLGWTHKACSVFIDTSDYIELDEKLEMKRLSKIIGKFPECSSLVAFSFPFDPYKINLGIVDTGVLNLRVQNPVRSKFDLVLESDECSFLPFSSEIEAFGETNIILGIRNDTIKPFNPDSIKLLASLTGAAGISIDTVDEGDTFKIGLEFRELVFSEFHGFIDTTRIEIPEVGKSIEYGFDPSGILFDSVWLYYNIQNEIQASPWVNIVVTGIRGAGIKSINLGIQLEVGENSGIVDGDTVTEFVNFFPESINMKGEVSLCGAIDVESSDWVWGEIGLAVPIDFELFDTLVIEPDTIIPVDVPKNVREANIVGSKLLVQIRNTSPLEGDVRLYLSPDSTSLGAPIFVVEFKEGKVEYLESIPVEELLKFDKLWGCAEVRFFPCKVRLFVRDSLLVKALLEVKIRLGG